MQVVPPFLNFVVLLIKQTYELVTKSLICAEIKRFAPLHSKNDDVMFCVAIRLYDICRCNYATSPSVKGSQHQVCGTLLYLFVCE